MFSYIRGEIAELNEDSIVLDNNGIGYLITMSAMDLKKISGAGETKLIYTYFQVSENGVGLFGFLTKDERDMFLSLLSVSGVGPKAAIAVLSVLSARDLKFAIMSDDEKAISKAPGVGGKTAKRIILELKDKVGKDVSFMTGDPSGGDILLPDDSGVLQKSNENDAYLALVSLGYSSSAALKAISTVEDRSGMETGEILKEALKRLSS